MRIEKRLAFKVWTCAICGKVINIGVHYYNAGDDKYCCGCVEE